MEESQEVRLKDCIEALCLEELTPVDSGNLGDLFSEMRDYELVHVIDAEEVEDKMHFVPDEPLVFLEKPLHLLFWLLVVDASHLAEKRPHDRPPYSKELQAHLRVALRDAKPELHLIFASIWVEY